LVDLSRLYQSLRQKTEVGRSELTGAALSAKAKHAKEMSPVEQPL
jgi:hypothetical protein